MAKVQFVLWSPSKSCRSVEEEEIAPGPLKKPPLSERFFVSGHCDSGPATDIGVLMGKWLVFRVYPAAIGLGKLEPERKFGHMAGALGFWEISAKSPEV